MQISPFIILLASFYLLPKLHPFLNGARSFRFIINSVWCLLIFLFLGARACSKEKEVRHPNIDVGAWGGDEERKVKA